MTSMLATKLHIAGKDVPASDARRFDVIYPATGQVVACVADAGVADAIDAVDAAAAPFGAVKQSGIAREGGHEGALDYTESKYLAVQW